MSPLLELKTVSRRFGGLAAVDQVNLSVEHSNIVGIIGPNGAGKTTLINLISCAIRPSSGEIHFKGRRIDGMPVHRVSRLGIARTFQIVQPFPDMTARENVVAAALFAGRAVNRTAANHCADQQLERVGLGRVGKVPASSLSLGQRKRLELAKSLAMKPTLLLLDEVNAGLHGAELSEAIALIRDLAKAGLTILIIEHLMKVVTSLCTRVAVLHHGRLIADGPAEAVMNDQQVIEAYLGERYGRGKGARSA